MNVPFPRRAFLLSSVGTAAPTLWGCDKGGSSGSGGGDAGGIEGVYLTVHDDMVFELRAGKADIRNMKSSTTSTVPYTVEGNKITVKGPKGNFVLTSTADGKVSGVPEALTGLPTSTQYKKAQ